MHALPKLSWDLNPDDGDDSGPRRPTLADVGGALLEDDAAAPPDKSRMPYSDQLNQWARQIVAMGRVCPLAYLSVDTTGPSPVVTAVRSPGTNITTGTFTVVREDMGIYLVSWPANALPALGIRSVAYATTDTSANQPIVTNASATSVRVKLRTAFSLVDMNFDVELR